jgi:hypothetical protein
MPHFQHELFKEPDHNDTLWRYMDLAKMLSMITTSEIFFTRMDKFEDPYEGIYSNPNLMPDVAKIKEKYNHLFTGKMKIQIQDLILMLRKAIYTSCWHLNEHESAAMWKLYSINEYGVAVKTNFASLRKSFENTEKEIHIGKVNYIDYDKETFVPLSVFHAPLQKRMSFQHENEVRVMISEISEDGTPKGFESLNIKVNLNKLIDTIYVAPTAPGWLVPLLENLRDKYDLTFKVTQSILYKLNY